MDVSPFQLGLAAGGTEVWEVASQNLVTQTGTKWSLSRDFAGSHPVLLFLGHTAGEQP